MVVKSVLNWMFSGNYFYLRNEDEQKGYVLNLKAISSLFKKRKKANRHPFFV
jgi:hypothetical protein